MTGGTSAQAAQLTVIGQMAGAEGGTIANPVPVVGSFVGAVVDATVANEAAGFWGPQCRN